MCARVCVSVSMRSVGVSDVQLIAGLSDTLDYRPMGDFFFF